MHSNNSSINRTNNNQKLAPGAPTTSHQQLFNHNGNNNFSQYGINNNYSNQNNLNNNFTNMVAAAGQQGGMDVGYNSQVYIK